MFWFPTSAPQHITLGQTVHAANSAKPKSNYTTPNRCQMDKLACDAAVEQSFLWHGILLTQLFITCRRNYNRFLLCRLMHPLLYKKIFRKSVKVSAAPRNAHDKTCFLAWKYWRFMKIWSYWIEPYGWSHVLYYRQAENISWLGEAILCKFK